MAGARRREFDERAAKLSATVQDCRMMGHQMPSLRDVVRETLRREKGTLVNMSSVVVDLACIRGCGTTRVQEYDMFSGELISSQIHYTDKTYLVKAGTGRLARADVRAAMLDSLLGG